MWCRGKCNQSVATIINAGKMDLTVLWMFWSTHVQTSFVERLSWSFRQKLLNWWPFLNTLMHENRLCWRYTTVISQVNDLSVDSRPSLAPKFGLGFVWRLLLNSYNDFILPRCNQKHFYDLKEAGCRKDARYRRKAEWVVRPRRHTETHA